MTIPMPMSTFRLLLLFTFVVIIDAADLDVKKCPPTFTLVEESSHKPLLDFRKRFVPNDNFFIGFYLPITHLGEYDKSKREVFPRSACITTATNFVGKTFDVDFYDKLKLRIKEGMYVSYLSKKSTIDTLNNEWNKNLSPIKMSANILPGETLVFLPHDESENYISSSILSSISTEQDNVKHTDLVSATNSVIFLGGKIYFINVYGDGNDLQYTRDISKEWVKVIFGAK